ncbi:pentapeptide repeat-containing protein [Phycisphaeraceae bacterium D3-23]
MPNPNPPSASPDNHDAAPPQDEGTPSATPPPLATTKPKPKSGLLAKLKPAVSLLGGGLLLLTGAVLGALFINAETVADIVPLLLAAAGFIVAVAFILIICLFILKQWLIPPMGQTAKRLMDRFSASIQNAHVTQNEDGGFSIAVPDLDPQETQGLKDDAQTLISAFLVTRGYWRTLFALGTLIGSAVITAQLLVMIEQSDRMEVQTGVMEDQTNRLSQQNTLIEQEGKLVSLQAQLDAITSKAEFDLQEAQREYDEITKILFEGTSPAAQEYALVNQLPEAMLMTVTIVDPDWAPPTPTTAGEPLAYETGTIRLYPNLKRLAEQLLVFAKMERLREFEVVSQDSMHSSTPSGRISTAIVRALHRLGNGGDQHATGNAANTDVNRTLWRNSVVDVDNQIPSCIWEIVFQENGSLYSDWEDRARAYLPHTTVQGSLHLREDPYALLLHALDLAHLKPGQLRGARLQYSDLSNALIQGVDLKEVHLQGANLSSARLQGSNLEHAQLQGVDFRGARLQDAFLADAQLQEADLSDAQLQGAYLARAHIQGANLFYTQLQRAELTGAQLQGANLTHARLQEAGLIGAQLQGARLVNTKLQMADLTNVQLQAATLYKAQLQGANLSGAELQGAVLLDTQLSGAELRETQLQGADLRSANLENTVLVLMAVDGAVSHWSDYSPQESAITCSFDISVARLTNINLGVGLILAIPWSTDSENTNDMPEQLVQHRQMIQEAFAQGKLKTAYWLNRDDAESMVCDALGEEFLKYLVEQPTLLKEARLIGVLFNHETLNSLSDNDLDIPVALAFQDAETDEDKINGWELFQLPDPAEVFSEQQAE